MILAKGDEDEDDELDGIVPGDSRQSRNGDFQRQAIACISPGNAISRSSSPMGHAVSRRGGYEACCVELATCLSQRSRREESKRAGGKKMKIERSGEEGSIY